MLYKVAQKDLQRICIGVDMDDIALRAERYIS